MTAAKSSVKHHNIRKIVGLSLLADIARGKSNIRFKQPSTNDQPPTWLMDFLCGAPELRIES